MALTHRQWLYHPQKGGKLFEIGDNPGPDWYDTPADFPKADEEEDEAPEEEEAPAANETAIWNDFADPEPPEPVNIRKLGKEETIQMARDNGIKIVPGEHWFATRARLSRELEQ